MCIRDRSSGNTEKQITLMHDFGSTVLCCTPSYALYLADAIKDSDVYKRQKECLLYWYIRRLASYY